MRSQGSYGSSNIGKESWTSLDPADADNVVGPGHDQFDHHNEILSGPSSSTGRIAGGHWVMMPYRATATGIPRRGQRAGDAAPAADE
jgi:hypothetical protein